MKNFVLSLFMLLALSSIVRGDAVSFEATVNTPRISMDEVMQLTLTVSGVNGNLDAVSLPVIDGFSAKYVGPSTSVSIINGDYHSEKSFVYDLFPNKVGKFQIPPISATFSGQTYSTKAIDIEVYQNSTQAQQAQASSPADQSQAPTADSLKDKVLIIVSVDKTQVYLNEQIPLSIKLLVNGVPLRDIQFPQFDKTGLEVDEFQKPEQGSQVVNGTRYDTVEFKTNIYPNHLGDLPLGPIQIQGNILYKNRQENPFNQEGNPFGADIFNGFFDSYATRPVTVTSQPINLHVSPLPDENRPPDFSGAIGQFDFEASVSPQQVKAGDPLTLKMDIKGQGNFKNFKLPDFHADGFKTYAPQIKGGGIEKTAEEVIIPTSANVKQVPVLHFSYFDTSIRDYKTLTQGPFDIHVMAPQADQEFKAVGFTDISHESSASSGKQFSWVRVFHKIQKFITKLSKSIWFWIGLGFVFIAGVSSFLWRRFQERLENDPAFARRLKAVREARKALMPAKDYISKGNVKDFYALISKVLRDYLANKWHQPSAALSNDDILSKLRLAKIDEGIVDQLKTILEQSDLVCFAGGSFDSDKMRSDLAQTQDLIARLEKSL